MTRILADVMRTAEKDGVAPPPNRAGATDQMWFLFVLGAVVIIALHNRGRKAKREADNKRDACDFRLDTMELAQHLERVLSNNGGTLTNRQFADAMTDQLDVQYEGTIDLNLWKDIKDAYPKMINHEHFPPKWSFVEQDAARFKDQATYLWDVYVGLARRVSNSRQVKNGRTK
eukprot:5420370-Pyramimonas_sp.AAC.1